MSHIEYIIEVIAGSLGLTGAYGLSVWLWHKWSARRTGKPGDLAIAQVQWDNAYSIELKKGVRVEQNQDDGSIAIMTSASHGSNFIVTQMSVLEARSLAAYIAAVTKYKHCAHFNCLEPEVPGIGYCRYHRIDLFTEGGAQPSAFLPEETNWPVNGKYEHVPEHTQGRQVAPEEIEREDLKERLSRYLHGD